MLYFDDCGHTCEHNDWYEKYVGFLSIDEYSAWVDDICRNMTDFISDYNHLIDINDRMNRLRREWRKILNKCLDIERNIQYLNQFLSKLSTDLDNIKMLKQSISDVNKAVHKNDEKGCH